MFDLKSKSVHDVISVRLSKVIQSSQVVIQKLCGVGPTGAHHAP